MSYSIASIAASSALSRLLQASTAFCVSLLLKWLRKGAGILDTSLRALSMAVRTLPSRVAFTLFMLLLDTLVSFIQAYVFTILSTIFISMALVEPHHQAE